jgi:hypothetical protein
MKLVLAILYIELVIIIACYAFVQARLNWDGLPYAAIVLSVKEHDPKVVHTRIYDAIGKEINVLDNSQKVASLDLLDGEPYRKDMACNWQHFNEQLGLYRMHVLYTGLSRIFHDLGLPVLQATRAVSTLSYLAIAAVIFIWLQKLIPGIGGMLTSLILMVLPPVLSLATLSTPDCLSGAIVLWAIYLFLQCQAPIACYLLLIISLCTRVDNLVILLAFLVISLASEQVFGKASLLRFLAWAVCAILISFALIYLTRSYGWSTAVIHGFCSRMTPIGDIKAHISLSMYLPILKHGLRCLLFTAQPFYVLFGVMTIILSRFRLGFEMLRRDPQVQVVVALLLGLSVRFLIFPAAEDRYFIGYDLGITLAFIKTVLTLRQNSHQV